MKVKLTDSFIYKTALERAKSVQIGSGVLKM